MKASVLMQSPTRASLAVFLFLVACGGEQGGEQGAPSPAADVAGDVGEEDNVPSTPADEDSSARLGKTTEIAATLRTTADLNLREGPSTDTAVLRVLAKGTLVTVLDEKEQNGFLNVEALGVRGWVSVKYLEEMPAATSPGTPGAPVDINGAPSPDNAIARAKPAVGFSYYWGGGAWLPEGPTASTKGSCSGNCPSCTHSGKYGADCSGLIAKAWQMGDKDLADNSHPFGTVHFMSPKAGYWSDAQRGAMKKGDALVHNSSGRGHIVLFEKGDPWGSPVVYECKGCAYGCVYNARAFGSEYKAIRRAGF